MGYDLYINRKVFVDTDKVNLSTYTKGNTKHLIVSELFINLNGWDLSDVVQEYVNENTQELEIEDIISLYKQICKLRKEKPNKSIIDILKYDLKHNVHYNDGGVCYEVIQSF
jgi:hypothetical protein